MLTSHNNAAALAARLSEGELVILEAPRRSGKSTLVEMIQELEIIPIRVICVSTRQAEAVEEFLTRKSEKDVEEFLIFDEPWSMKDSRIWEHAARATGCLLIGTPHEGATIFPQTAPEEEPLHLVWQPTSPGAHTYHLHQIET